jgi:dTDP-4-dehydrorhamnose reductase
VRVLITGVSGFLGWNLARRMVLRSDCEIVGTYFEHPPCDEVETVRVDFGKEDAIRALAKEIPTPDAIIHTAAIAKSAVCEKFPDRAKRVNTEAVRVLREVFPADKTYFLHCSTDLVFDGSNAPYKETDPLSPRGVYAETKAESEKYVLDAKGNGCAVRLALMYGDGPAASPSFLGWLNTGLMSKNGAQMFEDEFRTALYVEDAVEGILAILRAQSTGVFHLAGEERLSRADFARIYARTFGYDPGRVISAKLDNEHDSLYRPPDVSLECKRAHQELRFKPRPLDQALEDLKRSRIIRGDMDAS